MLLAQRVRELRLGLGFSQDILTAVSEISVQDLNESKLLKQIQP